MTRRDRLIERLDARLPGPHRLYGRYPKVGQHDRLIAELPNDEMGSEKVYRNRTGTKYVYIRSAYGYMSRSGVTSSKAKGELWARTVRRKARVLGAAETRTERRQGRFLSFLPNID